MTTLDQPTRTRSWLTRRRIVVAAIVLAVVAAVGLVWFQPQKLFIDQTVNEAAPGAVNDSMDDGMKDTMSGAMKDSMSDGKSDAMPMSLEGTFTSLAHDTKGTAVVKTLDDGAQVLRLAEFETSNGPDVRVYLSAGDEGSYGKDVVDLGGLKGNVGNQNYSIPSGTDLDRYDTVVIWCRRFTVAFGAAKLSA